MKLNELALGYAGAIISAACMLLLGVLANLGIYTGAAMQMTKWHMLFDLSLVGILAGTLEAAIIAFVFLYAFGFVYNWFVATN
jgi:hypothetical protein